MAGRYPGEKTKLLYETEIWLINVTAFKPVDLDDEKELVASLQSRNEAAFSRVVAQWQDMVFNTVLSIVQNAADAEELSQDVFVTVYEEIGKFKGEARFTTWLYRIAVNKSLEHLRKQKRKKRFAFVQSLFGANDELRHDPPEFLHPGILLHKKEQSIILAKAVQQLPEKQRLVFSLHKLEGLNQKEIATILDISEDSVSSLMYRAKQNLREALQHIFTQ